MDYKKHYDKLINRAKDRKLSVYTEKHHIIPKCMGGDNDIENLVNLLPSEHYVAHQLLIKIYPTVHQLIFAANMMTISSSKHGANRSKNKCYQWLRQKHKLAISDLQKGKKNSQFGTIWIYNSKKCISKKIQKARLDEYRDNGWLLGRRINWKPSTCKECNSLLSDELRHRKFCDVCLNNLRIKNSKKGRDTARTNRILATDAEVIIALRESNSYTDVLRKLGYKCTNGNSFARVKRIARENNILFN